MKTVELSKATLINVVPTYAMNKGHKETMTHAQMVTRITNFCEQLNAKTVQADVHGSSVAINSRLYVSTKYMSLKAMAVNNVREDINVTVLRRNRCTVMVSWAYETGEILSIGGLKTTITDEEAKSFETVAEALEWFTKPLKKK